MELQIYDFLRIYFIYFAIIQTKQKNIIKILALLINLFYLIYFLFSYLFLFQNKIYVLYIFSLCHHTDSL